MIFRRLRTLLVVVSVATVSVVGATIDTPTAGAAAKSTVTVKEYKRIKSGQSLAKVRRIAGGKGENVTTGARPVGDFVYMWRSTKGKDVYVKFLDSKVAKKTRLKDRTMSLAEKKKVKVGQSYGKVKKIARAKPAAGEGDGDVYFEAWCSSNGKDYWGGLFDAQTNKLKGKLDFVPAGSLWGRSCKVVDY